jgi:hypothetical protein
MDKKDLTFPQRILRLADMASTLARFAADLEDEYQRMKSAAERFEKQRRERATKKAA